MKYWVVIFFVVLFGNLWGQELVLIQNDSLCRQKDLPVVIREWRDMAPKVKEVKVGSLLLIPSIGANPATGFSFGVVGQYAFRLNHPGSLYSIVNAGITFTTKKQTIILVKNNVYTKNNKLFLSGDWRYLDYSQSTFGLGTNAPEDGILAYQYSINGVETTRDSLVQPMGFNHVRLHQTVSWQLKQHYYLGFGYHLDYHYKIEDHKLDLQTPLYTSHYTYSKLYGYNASQYLLSGLSANFIVDTRDNMINPYKGYFANINYRFYPTFMGNHHTANLLQLEWRSFYGLSSTNPRHLLAFWFIGNLSEAGKLPYLDLPALGYDQRGRMGRGYTQGRYRGPNMLYAEGEYRFPISRCGGIIGGVLFANATTADKPDQSVRLFDYVAPGYGFGLRIMVDKQSRTNIQVDFGFGKQSGGFYLGATETF